MHLKKTLGITIPTFNRDEILNQWLKKHAKLMHSKGVRIYIQDNLSTDQTVKIIKFWKKKYNNISFGVNNKNIGDKNFEVCLNSLNTSFVWLVGDTYRIDRKLLNKVLLIIKKKKPLFTIINLKERIKNLNDSYFDSDFVSQKLAGILSCISCVVYNKQKLGKIKFSEASWSHFSHTIYILNELKSRNDTAYWTSSSIYNLKSSKKKNWANTNKVFEIGCKNWIKSIDSLKGYNDISKEKSYRLFSDITNLFNFKGGSWLRAQGLLSLSNIKKYKEYLRKSVGIKYLILYIIAVVPIFILRNLKNIYYKCHSNY